MALDISTARTEVAKLYIAAFDRIPDSTGLNFWVNSLLTGADTLSTIAQKFTNSTEYQASYPTYLTTAEYVEKIYVNVFNRASDASGKAYWVQQVDSGVLTRGTLLKAMVDAALTTDKTMIANQATFGVWAAVNSADFATANAQLNSITSDEATLTAAKAAAVINSYVVQDKDAAFSVNASTSAFSTVNKFEVKNNTANVAINDMQNATLPLVVDDNVNAAATVTFNYDTQAVAGATAVNVSVSETNATLAVTGGTTDGIETLNLTIADKAGAVSTLTDLVVNDIETLNILGGTAGLAFGITGALDKSVSKVDASTAKANLSLNISEDINEVISVTLGSGDDTLITGDTIGDNDEVDTIVGGTGADKVTAVFTTAGTRNPVMSGVETLDLTFNNSATLDFTDVNDVATINVLASTQRAQLIDMDKTVTAINVTGAQTGNWDVDYEVAENATLAYTWTNNTGAASAITTLEFDEVKNLTVVANGTSDITLGNSAAAGADFVLDATRTTDLTLKATSNGDLTISTTADITTTDALVNLTVQTTSTGDIDFAGGQNIADLGALERLTLSAVAGDILVGALGTTTAAAQLEYVTVTTNNGTAQTGAIVATGATISKFLVTAGDDADSNVTFGQITAQDISEATITIEQGATVAFGDFVLSDAGDTLTASGEGTITFNVGAAIGSGAAADDSFFSTVNLGGLSTAVALNISGVTHAVNYTGSTAADTYTGSTGVDTVNTGNGDDVIVTGTGNDVITAGAGNDDITGGAGADTINVGTGNDTIRIVAAGDVSTDSGAALLVTNSTTTMDIVTGMGNGDLINLNALSSAALNALVALGSTGAAALGADDTAHMTRGTYNAATNTFTAGSAASDLDAMLVYDSTNGAAITLDAIVLVGSWSSVADGVTVAAGVITL